MNKNKKIVVCEIGYEKHEYPTKGLKKRWNELGYNVITYKGTERESFLLRNRHFQLYEDFLSFCEKEKADIAFIDTVVCPEHLLADLKVKKDFTPKIVFLSTFREPARSLSRANVFKELIENKHIKKVLMYSILGNKISPPSYWNDLNINKEKYELIGEPLLTEINEVEDVNLLENIKMPENKNVGLFFGRDDPSKGLKELASSFENLNEEVHIFIVSHGSEYTEEKAFEIEKENSTVIYRIIGDNEIRSVFNMSNFVILPYKKSYEYCKNSVKIISYNLLCFLQMNI